MEIALKQIAGDFNPMQLTLTRFLIGGIFLIPFAVNRMKKRGVRLKRTDLRVFALLGLIGVAVSMTFYQLAILETNASVVAVLFSSNPAFIMLLSALLLREVIHRRNVIAIVAEIVGIIILIGPLGAQVSAGGIILTLLSVLTFSLYCVMGKKKCMQYGGVTVTCLSFLFGAAELFVVVLLSHIGGVADYMTAHGMETYANIPLLTGYSMENIWIVLYICIGITGAGFASYFTAMERTSANTASLVFFFKPVLATILAAAILHEAVPSNMIAGIVLILVGSVAMLVPGLRPRGKNLRTACAIREKLAEK